MPFGISWSDAIDIGDAFFSFINGYNQSRQARRYASEDLEQRKIDFEQEKLERTYQAKVLKRNALLEHLNAKIVDRNRMFLSLSYKDQVYDVTEEAAQVFAQNDVSRSGSGILLGSASFRQQRLANKTKLSQNLHRLRRARIQEDEALRFQKFNHLLNAGDNLERAAIVEAYEPKEPSGTAGSLGFQTVGLALQTGARLAPYFESYINR